MSNDVLALRTAVNLLREYHHEIRKFNWVEAEEYRQRLNKTIEALQFMANQRRLNFNTWQPILSMPQQMPFLCWKPEFDVPYICYFDDEGEWRFWLDGERVGVSHENAVYTALPQPPEDE